MRYTWLYWVMGIFFCITEFAESRYLIFYYDSFTCIGNEKYTRNTSCQINETDHKTISTSTTFLKDISNLKLSLSIFMPKTTKPTTVPIMKWELSVCKFLENSLQNNFLKFLRETFETYSNLPKKCPLLKDTTYFIKNFTMDASDFPAFVPETSFTAYIDAQIPSKGNVYSVVLGGRLIDIKKVKKIH